MNRHFLCGCDSKDPHVRNYHPKLVKQNGQDVLAFKHFDKQGNEICPIHGVPLKGSAFPVKRGPQGNDVPDHHKDFIRRYGESRREIQSNVLDRRDNRDPVEVGTEVLTERETARAAGNGKRVVFGSEADIS